MKLNVKILGFGLGMLGLCAIALATRFPVHFQTSLTDLFPVKTGDVPLPAEGLAQYTGQLNIVLESSDFDALKKDAGRLHQKIINMGAKNITYRVSEDITKQTIDYFKKYKNSFLTFDTQTSDTQTIRQGAVQKLKTSLMPTVVPWRQDPFLLLSDYVQNMPRPMSLWNEKDGFLHQFRDGKNYLLMVAELNNKDVYDMIRQLGLIQKARLSAGTKRHLSGAPVHTAQIFQKCQFEISVISFLSVLGLLFLTYRLFRSGRAILYVAVNLGVGFLCGCIALFLFSPSVHILTFAFGCSLIGLCIDYSFHRFWAKAARQNVSKDIVCSFLTTVCCFLPLLFSDFPLLFQIAVFTLGGLAGTFIWIFVTSVPKIHPPADMPVNFYLSKRFKAIVAGLGILIVLIGMGWWSLDHSPQSLYQPSPALQREESLFSELNGPAVRRLLWIRANNLHDVLAKEETLRRKHDFFGLSVLWPARQEQNHQKIRQLYTEQSAALKAELGLTFLPTYEETPLIDEETFWAHFPMMKNFVVQTPRSIWTVTPIPEDVPVFEDKDVFFFEPAKHLSNQLDHQTSNSYLFLAGSFLLLFLLLGFVYRQRVLLYLFPSLLGSLGTVSILALCGQSITFFHLISLFVVVGLSMDYTVFLMDKKQTAFKPVFFSFLTSLVGFGLLSFISFSMIAIMGQTLALGLALSFLICFILTRESIRTPAAGGHF